MTDSTEKSAKSPASLVEGYHEIEERYRDLRDQAYNLNQKAMQVVEEHPVACVAGAFAVGYLIGKLAKRRWLL
ncbi:MAG: hypothetical protein R3E66_19595 [bacterium]